MTRSKTTDDGVLLVDKPAGVTSHDVVAVARRALGTRRIGHAGTLDPFATGLLVLLVGRATRLLPYVDGDPKVYRAAIRFGLETDTLDLLGESVATAAVPEHAAVLAALPALTGELEQVPPAFSAKRVGGRRAYDLARAGEVVELQPVRVRVDAWRVLGWPEPDLLDVEVTCGGGTYVRALARDLGRAVGSAAHLAALRRTRSGIFGVDEAQSLGDLEAGGATLVPTRRALGAIADERLDPDERLRVTRGIDVPATVPGDRAALIDAETGAMVAFAVRRGERWQPRVVLGVG